MSPSTVRRWVRQGALRARYHALSGRAYRLVFEEDELKRFLQVNFPSPEDLLPFSCTPKGQLIAKIQSMNRLFGQRGSVKAQMKRQHIEEG